MTKTVKRGLCSLLCAALLFASLPATVFAEDGDNAIHLTDADDLLQLAENCRLDSWSRDKIVYLDADIDLTGTGFSGIPSFGGLWEGGGHAISGLTLTADGSVQGLFRYIQAEGAVRQTTVTGTVQPGGSRAEVGGIAGENAGTIDTCRFEGTVTGTNQVGGIAGTNTADGVISGCTVSGSVYGDHFIGGVTGRNDGVVTGCTNLADINTTVSQNEVELEDLTVEDLLKTERAADITDVGGVAGSSSGVIRACVNRGNVGYDHIGYNVGGIAGSQSGYIEGCVNYGTVHARKEGGGIVGQMEPSSILQYSADTLQQLQGELDTLQGLMNKANRDAAASSSELTGKLNELQNQVNTARTAVNGLLDKLANGISIGTQQVTLTDLTHLDGSSNTDFSPSPTPAPSEEPTPTPDTTAEPSPTPDPAVTSTPEPQPGETPNVTETPVPTADTSTDTTEAPADTAPTDEPADRGEAAHGAPEPSGKLQHEGSLTVDGQLTLTVPSLEVTNRDEITAARNSLNGSLASLVDGVGSLNTDTGSHTQALIQDIQAITDQLNVIGNTLLGAAEPRDNSDLFQDVSDSDTDTDTEGKVFNCRNEGSVNADINAGGIAGAMARENDLDPEDDTKISGSSSLNVTYKSRIVIRDCENTGTVQAKKECAGGIVGSMDMGTVMSSRNLADLIGTEADYVGGIAGRSRSAIRDCAAKGRLEGGDYVGGIAGSGYTVTGCRALVRAEGTEWVGAIAGDLESAVLTAALADEEAEQTGNYFVSDTLGGIDGVSYAGQAEPLSFEDFAALTGQEGLPEAFRTIVLTFKADGAVVASETVDYGGSFDAARAPAVPAKDGCTAAWADFQTENIRFDQVVEAVYTPLSTVVAGSELREDGRPILLAEGSFGSGDLTMNASDAAPLATGKHTESWQFTLPESAGESWQMHYLPAGKNTAVYLRTADGSWRRADTTEDGSYLVFTVQPGEDTLAAVEQPELPVPLLAGGIAAALLLLAVAALVRRKHKNHAKA